MSNDPIYDGDGDIMCRLTRGIGPMSPALIMNCGCILIFIIAYARTWSNERDAPREKRAAKKKPEYGYGASGITLLLALMGLLFSLPIIILYFIWRQWNPAIACSIAWTSIGFPLWPCVFAALILALV
jgi:hypothetical protein